MCVGMKFGIEKYRLFLIETAISRSFTMCATVTNIAYQYVYACMMLAFPTIAIWRHPELRKIFLRLAFRHSAKAQVLHS